MGAEEMDIRLSKTPTEAREAAECLLRAVAEGRRDKDHLQEEVAPIREGWAEEVEERLQAEKEDLVHRTMAAIRGLPRRWET
jgi:hypothetical protein